MKKSILPIAVIAALLVVPGLIQVAVADTPESFTIDTNGKSKKVENFDHKGHIARMGGDAACVKCHHKLKPGGTPQKCEKCHTAAGEEGGAPKIKDAFHKTCKDCHKEHKADNPDLAKCSTCHG